MGDGDGALGSTPCGAAGVGSGEVDGAGELRDAEGVGVMGARTPRFEGPPSGGGVASVASGVAFEMAARGKRAASGAGTERVGRAPMATPVTSAP